MYAEEKKALVRRVFEELWSKGNWDVVDEIVHAQYRPTNIEPPLTRRYGLGGHQDFIYEVQGYRFAFPDLQVTLGEMWVHEDTVTAFFTMDGTFTGVDSPIQPHSLNPTGQPVGLKGVSINHIKDGKIWESSLYWTVTVFNQLTLLEEEGKRSQI